LRHQFIVPIHLWETIVRARREVDRAFSIEWAST